MAYRQLLAMLMDVDAIKGSLQGILVNPENKNEIVDCIKKILNGDIALKKPDEKVNANFLFSTYSKNLSQHLTVAYSESSS